MAKQDFDDLLHTLKVQLAFTGAAAASIELDFDIPRGYICKIKSTTLKIESLAEDFEGISVDKLASLFIGLIMDPDDTTSTGFSSGVLSHDVLAELKSTFGFAAGVAGDNFIMLDKTEDTINFHLLGDVFISRNMRMNIDASGTDAADITESLGTATVRYTLEEITNKDLLEILDIL